MFARWITLAEPRRHRDSGPDPEVLLAGLTPYHSPDRTGTVQMDGCTGVRALAGVVPEKVAWKRFKDMGGHIRRDDQPAAGDITETRWEDLHPSMQQIIDRDKLAASTTTDRGAPASETVSMRANQQQRQLDLLSDWPVNP